MFPTLPFKDQFPGDHKLTVIVSNQEFLLHNETVKGLCMVQFYLLPPPSSGQPLGKFHSFRPRGGELIQVVSAWEQGQGQINFLVLLLLPKVVNPSFQRSVAKIHVSVFFIKQSFHIFVVLHGYQQYPSSVKVSRKVFTFLTKCLVLVLY